MNADPPRSRPANLAMLLTPMIRLLVRTSLLALVLAFVPRAGACSIPVFRYALERWELGTFEVVVFHRGALPADLRATLDLLPAGNFRVEAVDLERDVSPARRALWERHGKVGMLPWVVVQRPGADAKARAAFTGPMQNAALRRLIDSPARQRIVTELAGGDTAVFILLLSGDQAADDAADGSLRRELARLEKRVKLPEQTGEGPRIRLALPLKVSFTVLPLRRDARGEEDFVRLLLGSEDELSQVRGPIVFPVFGRGRLLGSLYGTDLSTDGVLEVVRFLCGECSCQVKELNPGSDLLVAADWSAIFRRIGPAPADGPAAALPASLPAARAKPQDGPLPIVPGAAKPAAVRVGVSHYPAGPADSVPPEATADAPHRRWLWVATALAAVLVVVTGAWACIPRRRA